MDDNRPGAYGEAVTWSPEVPRLRPLRLLLTWFVAAIAVLIAAAIVPGVDIKATGGAVLTAVLLAVLNALIPPVVAAVRLPFTLATGFLLVLLLDALILVWVSDAAERAIHVDGFGEALLAAIVIAAAMVVLETLLGANDDDTYTLRVIRRVARRHHAQTHTDRPGLIMLEIDGLALPVLKRALRDGFAPNMARWLESGTHQLDGWETDLSSQTGASQAGILLGSNEGIPAFRWVEKDSGRTLTCSSPDDCAEIEARLASGDGLLTKGGASRGNLFSGEAEATILTVSRMSAEKRSNPGYRAFLSNGFNVTRLLALVFWEVVIERVAAIQQKRRGVLPRGHRTIGYAFLRAALCVGVRDLIVFGVLTDVMGGRPAIYATFSSYDEVAHHSGLERSDTREALRKLDEQFGRIERALRYAPRPYEIVVLSDHGQTQGATFLQRNGYDLQDLVARSVERGSVAPLKGGDENAKKVGFAVAEATGRASDVGSTNGKPHDDVIVLASGNLGLVYLMEEPRRLTLEEIDERHPRLIPTLRMHPHVGLVMAHSSERGPVVMGPRGTRWLDDDRVVGQDPLAPFSARAADHLWRNDGFTHAPDLYVNSFYDPDLEQGCAFEELISFHGGLGGPQTEPFLLHPTALPMPDEPVVGAAAVHQVLWSWRRALA
jgi:uncharacterized membrane protein YvlD (DUF360 family)